MKIILIGISDEQLESRGLRRENSVQQLEPLRIPAHIEHLLGSGYYFSGGKRHHEIIKPFLPKEYEWIDIAPPVQEVVMSYKGKELVTVIASGDPIFSGIGERIMKVFPDAEIELYPHFNSLQMLAHRVLLPYQDMHTVSLTGRPWLALDEALIRGERMIGILTDNREHTPKSIATRMLEYGYDNYEVYVGELLGNQKQEQVTKLKLEEVAKREFRYPNNLILKRVHQREKHFGIPDGLFTPLNGRERMITKMPIRLLTLSMLELHHKQVMWDIGSCTGSVAIEAKLQFPHLDVVAYEIRPEGATLLEENSRKFGTPGIHFYGGDFMEQKLDLIPDPDAIFIGGHGGNLAAIIQKAWPRLSPGGLVAFNSVREESSEQFAQAIADVGGTIETETMLSVDKYNPIRVLKAIKEYD